MYEVDSEKYEAMKRLRVKTRNSVVKKGRERKNKKSLLKKDEIKGKIEMKRNGTGVDETGLK